MGCCGWGRADEAPPEIDGVPEAAETVMARRMASAESDLVAVTGGASLCRIGDSQQAGSAKYAEGRHAALRELRHVLRSSDQLALAAAIELLETWQVARSEARGPAWIAYREGGVAELRALVDDLTTTTDCTP